jgi:hypothetical protein
MFLARKRCQRLLDRGPPGPENACGDRPSDWCQRDRHCSSITKALGSNHVTVGDQSINQTYCCGVTQPKGLAEAIDRGAVEKLADTPPAQPALGQRDRQPVRWPGVCDRSMQARTLP